MNYRTIRLSLVALLALTSISHAAKPLSRIAFGSCAKQDRPQPIWDAIIKANPQLFLMIGDNIYGDTEDMKLLKAKYEMLGSKPGFARLRKICPIMATWDDHDYGVNDGGREYPKRVESQKVFLDFFGEPKDSPRRKRKGIYDAKIIGPAGKRVQIILLDTRYFRSKLTKGAPKRETGEGLTGPYVPDRSDAATVLGEAQWKWLEEQLRKPAEVRIVASSIQLIANDHWWEKWGNFPRERLRFFRLLQKTKANGVVVISGDRHKAEISRIPLKGLYPVYDITSSSLNAPSGNRTKLGVRFRNEVNRYRVGLMYFDTNFGMLTIDWKKADPVLRMQVCDEKGNVVLQHRLRLSRLQPVRRNKKQ